MSMKGGDLRGRVFDPDKLDELPTFAKDWTPGEREAWCTEQTARYAVAGTCRHCNRAMTASEVLPHGLKHASSGRVRSAAGTVLGLPTAEEITEAIALIEELKGAR